jgi:hypothetical protein
VACSLPIGDVDNPVDREDRPNQTKLITMW